MKEPVPWLFLELLPGSPEMVCRGASPRLGPQPWLCCVSGVLYQTVHLSNLTQGREGPCVSFCIAMHDG